MHHRDRQWLSSTVGALCGPFDMPSVEALRAAVVAVSERHPHSRLTWQVGRHRKTWRTDALHADPTTPGLVVDRSDSPEDDFGAMIDSLVADDEIGWPLGLVRYENYLGLRMSHGLGDGRMYSRVVSSVMQTAFDGEVRPWSARPARGSPLLAGVRRTFGHAPMLLRSAVADRPKAGPPRSAGEERLWRPSRATEVMTLAPAVVETVSAWAATNAPRASMFALYTVLLMRGLEATGIVVDPQVSVLFDLRRYLADGSVDGNFVAGVPLNIGARQSPEDVSSALRSTAASGRPLATQAMTVISGVRAGHSRKNVDCVDLAALPRLTVSSLGRPTDVGALPYVDRAKALYIGGVEPDGPLGITALMIETSGGLHISLSFHDNVIGRQRVRDTMKWLRTDPLRVLEQKIRS